MGIKGESHLQELIIIPDQMAIDYMHKTLQGVTNALLSLYLKQNYISIANADSIQKLIVTPSCFN